MADPVDAAAAGATGHATWPDVALWVLQHDGPMWALAGAVILISAWKHDAIVAAWSNALDHRAVRRATRRLEARELAVAQERLDADMRAAEVRLQLPHRGPPQPEGEGG